MKSPDLVDQLAEHKTLGAAPREELTWLASHGSLRQLETGEVLTAKGLRVEGLFVVLSGRIAIFVDRGAGPHKIMEWRTGDVTGLLPYSRMVSPPGSTIAQEPTEILAVPGNCLRAMTHECYEVTAILVHSMLDRARTFNSSDLQNEKMISLGKLSAGLAHELNNPASAIERSAVLLEDRPGPDSGRWLRAHLEGARRAPAARNQRARCVRGRRPPRRGHEPCGLSRGRGINGGTTRA